jgi:hemoglobin
MAKSVTAAVDHGEDKMMVERSLFEKYGGFSKISRVVLSFYDTLLDSDEIGPFFDDIDMSKMVDHQTKFIASLLGGPASYTDRQLHQLHRHLDITDAHFDELKVVLKGTLQEHGVETDDVDIVLMEFENRRIQIVGPSNVD